MIKEMLFDEYKDVNDLILDVQAIHEVLFPNATLASQIAKYEEESEELQLAYSLENVFEEFADVFIVACGIRRFSLILGTDLLKQIIDSVKHHDDKITLMKAVCKKMNKNQTRDWGEASSGYYKHKVHTIH